MTSLPRRSLQAGLAVAISLVVLVGLLISLRQPQPSLNGRTLNDWLADLDLADESSRLAAERAIAHIGSQAVPFLRAQLARRDPFLAPAFRKIEPYLPRWAWRHLFSLLKPAEIETRRRQAATGLGLIGPPAAVAIPDLIRALSDTNLAIPPAASQALYRIGPAAWPALTNALPTAPTPARLLILAILAKHEPQANLALPAVLDLMARTSRSDEIRGASRVLDKTGPHALAALFELARSTDTQTRNNAIRALQFLAESNPALPLKLGELYPAQPLAVRAALIELFEQTALQRYVVAYAMLPAAIDPDPQLQQRAILWLRQQMPPRELDRLLATQAEATKLRLRNVLFPPSAESAQ